MEPAYPMERGDNTFRGASRLLPFAFLHDVKESGAPGVCPAPYLAHSWPESRTREGFNPNTAP